MCLGAICQGIEVEGGICEILFETTNVPQNERTKHKPGVFLIKRGEEKSQQWSVRNAKMKQIRLLNLYFHQVYVCSGLQTNLRESNVFTHVCLSNGYLPSLQCHGAIRPPPPNPPYGQMPGDTHCIGMHPCFQCVSDLCVVMVCLLQKYVLLFVILFCRRRGHELINLLHV